MHYPNSARSNAAKQDMLCNAAQQVVPVDM